MRRRERRSFHRRSFHRKRDSTEINPSMLSDKNSYFTSEARVELNDLSVMLDSTQVAIDCLQERYELPNIFWIVAVRHSGVAGSDRLRRSALNTASRTCLLGITFVALASQSARNAINLSLLK